MPVRFAESLSRFEEIWAPSEFVRAAFAGAVNVPVLRIPVPVELGEIAPVTRAAYGLPEDATLFLFYFDPSSFVERKNPIAVVEAFHRAFRRARGLGRRPRRQDPRRRPPCRCAEEAQIGDCGATSAFISSRGR